MGLLLYGGPGLMRSLTTVLSVEAGALGVGFFTAPASRPDLVDALRRRWLFTLVAFLVATLFSAFWSVVELVGGSSVGQGLGLAFLAALPLYASGALLGAMGTVADGDPGRRSREVGGPAALGAALGFAATGASLPQVFTPASLLLICLVLLSAGGLVYGSVLDNRLRVHVRARRPSPLGDVRVEDRQLLARDQAARILLEGEHVRRWLPLGDDVGDRWDLAAFLELVDGGTGQGSVLLVGGGASSLPRTILREHPGFRVDVVERSHAVVELGREHLDTGMGQGVDPRLDLRVGNPDDATAELPGPYHVVMVDTAALAPQGGAATLSARHRKDLAAGVHPDGALVLGPLPIEAGGWTFPEGWSHGRYVRGLPEGLGALGVCLAPNQEILVGSPDAGRVWPLELGAFARVVEPAP